MGDNRHVLRARALGMWALCSSRGLGHPVGRERACPFSQGAVVPRLPPLTPPRLCGAPGTCPSRRRLSFLLSPGLPEHPARLNV